MPLVSQKCMFAVELMPGEVHFCFRHSVVNDASTLEWNVRILAAPNHHQFRLDFRHSVKRVVISAIAQTTLMDVRCVKANARF